MNIVWIIVVDEKSNLVFEGHVNHWKDCFYSNPTKTNIMEFCEQSNLIVTFLEDVPKEFNKNYVKENLPILED